MEVEYNMEVEDELNCGGIELGGTEGSSIFSIKY